MTNVSFFDLNFFQKALLGRRSLRFLIVKINEIWNFQENTMNACFWNNYFNHWDANFEN